MSLSDNIADFATRGPNDDGTYPVTRNTEATRVSGRAQAPAVESTFAIVAQVYPTDGRDLLVLAEAQIKTDSAWLLTITELMLVRDQVQVEGDGVLWTVVKCANWPDQDGGTVYKALVARQSMR